MFLFICLHTNTKRRLFSCSDDAIQRHDQGPVKTRGLPTPSPCTATPMPVLPGTCTLLQASAGDPGTLLPHAMLVTPRAALSASHRDRVRSSQGRAHVLCQAEHIDHAAVLTAFSAGLKSALH